MQNGNMILVSNVRLRALMLTTKFGFVFVAARFLELDELGAYSLLAVSVGCSLSILGLDLYIFANREIIRADKNDRSSSILNQFRLYSWLFMIFSVPLLSIFLFEFLAWQWVGVFYALLIFEHISQEFVRLSVSLGRPLMTSILLFIKSASWAMIVLLPFVFISSYRSVYVIYSLWLFASFIAVCFGFYCLRFIPWRNFFKDKAPITWWWTGIKVAFPFLITNLSIRLLFLVDRFYIEFIDGMAMVGVYAVYIGLCGALYAFLDAALFQFKYPVLVRLVKEGDSCRFREEVISLFRAVVVLSGFSAFALFVGHERLFSLLTKPAYLDYMGLFWGLLIAHFFLVLSYVPHYALYALKQDRWIFFGNLAPPLVFIVALFFMEGDLAMTSVVIGLNIAFLCSFLIKLIGILKPYRELINKGNSYA